MSPKTSLPVNPPFCPKSRNPNPRNLTKSSVIQTSILVFLVSYGFVQVCRSVSEKDSRKNPKNCDICITPKRPTLIIADAIGVFGDCLPSIDPCPRRKVAKKGLAKFELRSLWRLGLGCLRNSKGRSVGDLALLPGGLVSQRDLRVFMSKGMKTTAPSRFGEEPEEKLKKKGTIRSYFLPKMLSRHDNSMPCIFNNRFVYIYAYCILDWYTTFFFTLSLCFAFSVTICELSLRVVGVFVSLMEKNKKNKSFKKELCSDSSFSKENDLNDHVLEQHETMPTMVHGTFKGGNCSKPLEAGPSGTKKEKGKSKGKMDMQAFLGQLSGVHENINLLNFKKRNICSRLGSLCLSLLQPIINSIKNSKGFHFSYVTVQNSDLSKVAYFPDHMTVKRMKLQGWLHNCYGCLVCSRTYHICKPDVLYLFYVEDYIQQEIAESNSSCQTRRLGKKKRIEDKQSQDYIGSGHKVLYVLNNAGAMLNLNPLYKRRWRQHYKESKAHSAQGLLTLWIQRNQTSTLGKRWDGPVSLGCSCLWIMLNGRKRTMKTC